MIRPLPTTAPEMQREVDADLVTWPDVIRMLRDDVHIPEGAIEKWRACDRGIGEVLVAWLEREVMK